jgi:hypothetical protein
MCSFDLQGELTKGGKRAVVIDNFDKDVLRCKVLELYDIDKF